MKLDNVLITSVKTTRDGSLKITLETQELTSEDKASLFDFHQAACTVTIESPIFLPE